MLAMGNRGRLLLSPLHAGVRLAWSCLERRSACDGEWEASSTTGGVRFASLRLVSWDTVGHSVSIGLIAGSKA